jgi:hypothetical protein
MRGGTNAAEVNGVFAKLQWTSDRAQAEAVRLGTQMNEISAKTERLKSGNVQPEELGITFPVRGTVDAASERGQRPARQRLGCRSQVEHYVVAWL